MKNLEQRWIQKTTAVIGEEDYDKGIDPGFLTLEITNASKPSVSLEHVKKNRMVIENNFNFISFLFVIIV